MLAIQSLAQKDGCPSFSLLVFSLPDHVDDVLPPPWTTEFLNLICFMFQIIQLAKWNWEIVYSYIHVQDLNQT